MKCLLSYLRYSDYISTLPGGGWGAGWYNKQLSSKVKREFHKESSKKIPRRTLGRAILATSSVQLLSHVWLFGTPWTVACQASLSITNSQNLLKLMSTESVMPFNNLILCHPLLLLPWSFPRIMAFSYESVLHIKCPKYWHCNFSISPSNEYSGLISFRMDWLDLLAV